MIKGTKVYPIMNLPSIYIKCTSCEKVKKIEKYAKSASRKVEGVGKFQYYHKECKRCMREYTVKWRIDKELVEI